MIELADIGKWFDEAGRSRVLFRALSLTIPRGVVAVIRGPSGSGKTTLLNLMSGIDLPSRGRVRVAGCDLTGLADRDRTLFRRVHVGFVFQFFNLLPTLTALENVRLALELQGVTGARANARTRAWLERVGLGERAGAYADRLSGGEQQRVALARALVHEPALILADEPTGNLDAGSGQQVLELLVGLVRAEQRTAVVVTHSIEAARMADLEFEIRGAGLVLSADRRGLRGHARRARG